MPKKSKKETKSVSPKDQGAPEATPNGTIHEVFQCKPGCVLIQVMAKPGAKRTEVVDISTDGIGVAVQAPPVDGKANEEIVNFVAQVLGIRKNTISIERGHKSRHKTLRVDTDKIAVEEVKAKLFAEVGK